MIRLITALLCFSSWCLPAAAQQYTTANAHSHNDYEHAAPFRNAFARSFGSIEADVYERNGELFVAHDSFRITPERTLRALYLTPLQQAIREKGDSLRPLQLLIDLKSAGERTLQTLVHQLKQFPEITTNPKIKLVISGSMPAPEQWAQYPSFIWFDGRPALTYTADQLARIALISDSFSRYAKWDGKGTLGNEEELRIRTVIGKVHGMNKPFRFWGTPDNITTWDVMMKLGVDYLNTDKIDALADYLEKR